MKEQEKNESGKEKGKNKRRRDGLERGDGVEEEVDPEDFGGGGGARRVGIEAEGDGAGPVMGIDGGDEHGEGHHRRRALHPPLLAFSPTLLCAFF